MKSAKQATLELVGELPDEVSMQTILTRLQLLAHLERGLAEADRGEVVSHEDVMVETRQWLNSLGR